MADIEARKGKTLVKWWDKLIDRLILAAIIAAGVVLLKWLNAPPELLGQFGH